MKTLKDILKNQTVLKLANYPNFSLKISLTLRTEPFLLIIDTSSYSSWKSLNFRFCIYLLNIYCKKDIQDQRLTVNQKLRRKIDIIIFKL